MTKKEKLKIYGLAHKEMLLYKNTRTSLGLCSAIQQAAEILLGQEVYHDSPYSPKNDLVNYPEVHSQKPDKKLGIIWFPLSEYDKRIQILKNAKKAVYNTRSAIHSGQSAS